MSKKDLFRVEKLALAYCDTYGYAMGSKEGDAASAAFCSGFSLGKKDGEQELHNAQKAFDKMVEDGDFNRIAKTPDETGYHYGLVKEKYPNMPEPQLRRACSLLDAGWTWEGYSCKEIVLGCQLHEDLYEWHSIGEDGEPVTPSIKSRMEKFK